MNKKVIEPLAVAMLWIAFLSIHYHSVYSSLYESTWWLDIMMHAVGGFLVVTTWYQIKNLNAFSGAMSYIWLHPLVILWLMMVGWELFEFYFGLVTQTNYAIDTLYDFINGFSGGLLSFILFRSRTIKK